MAEGAQLPWKVQKINQCRGPTTNYKDIFKPLPNPPAGMEWRRDDDTSEWILAPRQLCINHNEKKDVKAAEVLVDTPTSKQKRVAEEYVEGVDFVEHTVLPSDTFQGICLAYGIKPHQLRQANRFSGSNLLLAPSKLVIPLHVVADPSKIKCQDKNSSEMKIHLFLAEIPQMRLSEAKAYLELADWDVEEAIANSMEDSKWERENSLSISQKNKTVANTNNPKLDVGTTTPTTENVSSHNNKTLPIYRQQMSSEINDGQVEMRSLMDPLLPKGLH